MANPAPSQDPIIRRARPGEAAALGALALRSKAHWGYDDAFLEACRADLALTAAEVARDPVYVIAAGDGPRRATIACSPRATRRTARRRARTLP